MNNKQKIGLIGAGGRALGLLAALYQVRERRNLVSLREDGHPGDAYEHYAHQVPDWAQDLSSFAPSVSAVLDKNEANRQKAVELCQEHGDKPAEFSDLETFLGSGQFDAVIIATPNDAHTQILLPLLERGVDVLCEKPIATTLKEHDTLIKAAEKSESKFYVGFNLRSAPLYRRIHEAINQGAIGKPMSVSCREVRGPFREGYRYEPGRSGGALLEKNCHDFDLFNWYMDADPIKVSAFGGQHVLNKNSPIMDAASVIVEYDGGQIGTLELCMYAPYAQQGRTYELRGDRGMMRSPEQPDAIDCFAFGRQDRLQVDSSPFGTHSGGDMLQMLQFLKFLRGQAQAPASLRDAKKSAAIALAAEVAIEEQRVVEIDENYDLV